MWKRLRLIDAMIPAMPMNNVDMNSEAEVLGYGISLILLNVGMYVVAPVIVVVGIKKRI